MYLITACCKNVNYCKVMKYLASTASLYVTTGYCLFETGIGYQDLSWSICSGVADAVRFVWQSQTTGMLEWPALSGMEMGLLFAVDSLWILSGLVSCVG